MRLIRSWPAEIPENRGYVVDGIERLVMGGYDYRCLADIDDDICLIEWDIAVGGDDLARFMDRCKTEPDRVRVAPYILYPRSTRSPVPVWAHRLRAESAMRFVTPDDPVCHLFGFGLTYLPKAMVGGFMETLKRPKDIFNDSTFSSWHFRRQRHVNQVPIDWDVRLVHLHYHLPEV